MTFAFPGYFSDPVRLFSVKKTGQGEKNKNADSRKLELLEKLRL